MHLMPPTTELLSRNFLDETVFLDHRRRAGTKGDADAHEPKGAPSPELEHSVPRSRICREHASPADPNRFAANRLASSTSFAYRDAARGEMRVLSAYNQDFPLSEQRRQIGEEVEQSLEPGDLDLALGDRQTEPVRGYRPGGGGPKLVDVLWYYAERFAARVQRVDRCVHRGEGRVCGSGEPKQDVGVEEDQIWAFSRSP
jgi:hypothetical protein